MVFLIAVDAPRASSFRDRQVSGPRACHMHGNDPMVSWVHWLCGCLSVYLGFSLLLLEGGSSSRQHAQSITRSSPVSGVPHGVRDYGLGILVGNLMRDLWHVDEIHRPITLPPFWDL